MQATEVITQMWERIENRDWAGLRALLADDVRVYWPASRELIQGAENFVAVQSEYPEGWSIRVLSIVSDGEQVVSEVEVPHEGMGVFRVASFWTVRKGLIVEGREYWVTVGSEMQPEWRRPLAQVVPD